MIRILIADDHAVVRQGLKKILAEYPDMSVEGEAGSTEELMEVVGTNGWDILILDISMGGRSGLDAFEDIRVLHPNLPVLFFSLLPEEHFAFRVLKLGAGGYLAKEAPVEELINAIRKVSSGRKYVSPALAEKMAGSVSVPADVLPHEKLSSREFQIFRKLAAGKTLIQIAAELFLSPKTVTTHRARILAKLNMTSNADLTRYAVEHKLIE